MLHINLAKPIESTGARVHPVGRRDDIMYPQSLGELCLSFSGAYARFYSTMANRAIEYGKINVLPYLIDGYVSTRKDSEYIRRALYHRREK